MRVAAVYDVHGNLPALEAVLEEIREEGVDQVVVGGDVVPGPMPVETLSTLLNLSIPARFIHGNGETAMLTLKEGGELTRVPAQMHAAMRWVAGALLPEHFAAFTSWPLSLTIPISGLGNVLFCHATPRDDNEVFTRLTPEERLRPVLEVPGADLVVCGHTHMQFDRRVGRVRVVNAGSVGLPFGRPGAYWLLLGPTVDLRRTSYPLAEAQEAIRRTDYPQTMPFEIRYPQPEGQMEEILETRALGNG